MLFVASCFRMEGRGWRNYAQLLIQIGGRNVPDALDRIRRYCGLTWSGGSPETWVYRYFDLVASERPDEVTPIDVLAAAALHPGLSRTDLAFFVGRTDDLSDWLRSIPADANLQTSDSNLLSHFDALVDFESMRHLLKMTLPNGRARSVGRHRQLFDFHGYQAHIAITALLAWHHRTGADLSRWFGQWKPPNHAVATAA